MDEPVTYIYAGYNGTGAISAVICGADGTIEAAIRQLPPLSSSQGELLAILLALQFAQRRGWTKVVVLSDNTEAVGAARKELVPATSPFAKYHPTLQILKGHFDSIEFRHLEGCLNAAHPICQVAIQVFTRLSGASALNQMLAGAKNDDVQGGK